MNREELDKFYDTSFPQLVAFANQILNNAADAEDVVQTVFVRSIRYLASGESIARPGPFFFRAVEREATSQIRKRGRDYHARTNASNSDLDAKSGDSPLAEIERREGVHRIRSHIRKLPARERLVMRRVLLGASSAEIAQEVYRTHRTVNMWRRSAFEKLMRSMDDDKFFQ